MPKILLSRTDSIGDVILTLPLAGLLKSQLPEYSIDFIGRKYTIPVLERCEHIDRIYDLDNLDGANFPEADIIIHVFPRKEIATWAKSNGIPERIGTSHRIYHWLRCNRLVNLGRKNSDMHEALLNIQLARPLKIELPTTTEGLYKFYGWKSEIDNKDVVEHFLSSDKFNLIIHAKSKGSAKEWPLSNFCKLAERLDPNLFNIILTGTDEEGDLIKNESPQLLKFDHVVDSTGKLTLSQLIDLIELSDGLLAASTGPLHIAAASGIHALGLYPYDRPMHAGRWGPIGEKADAISEGHSNQSHILDISVEAVFDKINQWKK